MPDQVDEDVKEARLDKLMFAQRAISREKNRALVGTKVEVLVEGKSDESDLVWVGRTSQQAPDIDGVTYLSGFEDDLTPGQIVFGLIEQVTDYDLVVGPA